MPVIPTMGESIKQEDCCFGDPISKETRAKGAGFMVQVV
jgi:hypothetical protein